MTIQETFDVVRKEIDRVDENIDRLKARIGTLEYEHIENMKKFVIVEYMTKLNFLLQADLISKAEHKSLYKMLISPDKENAVVANEAIANKLKEI